MADILLNVLKCKWRRTYATSNNVCDFFSKYIKRKVFVNQARLFIYVASVV